jgi:hypothetical protein
MVMIIAEGTTIKGIPGVIHRLLFIIVSTTTGISTAAGAATATATATTISTTTGTRITTARLAQRGALVCAA